MLRSMVFQVIWAPALALIMAVGLLGVEAFTHARLAQTVGELTSTRQQLEQRLLRLVDRHERTVRRARESMLDTRQDNRVAILSFCAEHYAQEMDKYLAEAKEAMTPAQTRTGSLLHPDWVRLSTQLDALSPPLGQVAAALAALLEGAQNDDPGALQLAQQDLDRADRDALAELRRLSAMARRALDLRLRTLADSRRALPLWAWGAFCVWVPMALYLGYRPLARLRRGAQSGAFEARSHEERAIEQRARSQDEALARNEEELTRRTRETERGAQLTRRVEHELALLRLYSENLVNSLRSAVVVTDLSGGITSVNRAARELLSLDEASLPASLEAHPLYAALSSRAPGLRDELTRAGAAKVALRFDGVPTPHPRGERLLDVTLVPYLDESGAARGFLWLADDVTEAVQTKNQLLVAERLAAVGRLSAQVAHEIRNPLSAIGLNAELLQDDFGAALPEPQRTEAHKLLGAIASEVERLREVTEGYLQLARLPRPSFKNTDLNQLVSDLCSMLNEEMKAHHVDVALDLANPAPHAWADPAQLRQGMLNIIRNSREAMPGGGKLEIRTARADGQATIEIADHGPGMPPETRRRVFEPFFSTKADGTGLGLSLTRQIINEHGGHIDIDSNHPTGTRVRLVLPEPSQP